MIVVDVETTGLNPLKHSIVSIGAIDFLNTVNYFYQECGIWKGAEITDKALKINGFTKQEITDSSKKTLKQITREFLLWTEDCKEKIIAGENPSFDRDFLRASSELYGFECPFRYRTVDLHSLCYAHHIRKGTKIPLKDGKPDLSLDYTLEYVGLPRRPDPKEKPHNALTDARLEAEAFSRLIYGKALLKEFKNFRVPRHLKK